MVFDLRSISEEEEHIRMVKFYDMDVDETAGDEEQEIPLGICVVQTETEDYFGDGQDLCQVIVDSGADATVLPASFLGVGAELSESAPRLQDAQGEHIQVKGYKNVCFCFRTEQGTEVEIHEKAHFAEGINQPIISFGKMVQAGWGIDGEDRVLTYGGGSHQIRIPLKLQNRSLIAEGYVRAIQTVPYTVRVLETKLTKELEDKARMQSGWVRAGDRWIGIHLGKRLQTPQYHGEINSRVSWRRTTLIKQQGRWQMVELCEALHGLTEQEEIIEEAKGENVLTMTILTRESCTTEELGFEVDTGMELAVQPVERRDEELPIEEGRGVEEAHDEPVREESIEQEGRLVAGGAMPGSLMVNGIELTQESKLRELRAACGFYGISTSGSKLKCYQRLVSYIKELEIKAASAAVAAAEMEVARRPRAQPLVRVPSDEEQALHELTHTPYQPWCETCLMHRGRPDRHLRTGAARLSGIPIVSMDFCYTKAGEMDRPAPMAMEEDGREVVDLQQEEEAPRNQDLPGGTEMRFKEVKNALWLVLSCSQTGSLAAVPLQSKGQLSLMCRETMTFIQNLGHTEVGLYADNEPTMRALLRILLNSRHALGLRTRIYTTRVKDSAGNSLAENAIQRIRGLAGTLMESLMKKVGLRFNSNHALWSWAARHAAWTLNRYQASRGVTSFELTQGRSYESPLVPFGCPVYAYLKPLTGKGNPRWRMAIFLGKTEGQDAWAVGEGQNVLLTRSVRRIDRPWSKFMTYFRDFTAHSWEFQVNFGGRIVPSKRAVGPIPLNMRRKSLPADPTLYQEFDEEAKAVEDYARSKEGQEEAEKEIQEVQMMLGATEEAVSGTLVAEGGVPAPRAPQVDEQSLGLPTTPVLAMTHPGGEGSEGFIPMEVPPMPWEEDKGPQEERFLRKTPPPPSAAKSEPEAKKPRMESFKKQRIEEEGATSSSSTARKEMVERRVEAVSLEGETMYHLDEVIDVEALEADGEQEDVEDLKPGAIPDALWSDEPLNRTPPQPSPTIEQLADKVEEQRLKRMGVIADLETADMMLDKLTTKFVRDWRIKTCVREDGTKVKRWLRRSRLVAREFANDKRDDVYSPASGSYSLRLLPMIFLTMRERDQEMDSSSGGAVLGALDVKDAFLQVPQERPLQISTSIGKYKVLRNLPGQRVGAKAWFEHVQKHLIEDHGFTFDVINPCLGRCGEGGDRVHVLIHVDDIMFTGRNKAVERFVDRLKAKFEVEVSRVEENGQEFSFLKRTYKLSPEGLLVKPGQYAGKMIALFEETFGQAKRQRIPASSDIQDADSSSLVGYQEATAFRSITGMGIYLAQERLDIAYTIKELASKMSSPTEVAVQRMRKLVGYLKETEHQHILLPNPVRGEGINTRGEKGWLLETFSDADWSGCKSTRRSTSSAVHAVNGLIVYSSSRGQKTISLSSAESELNALVAAACDGICLKHSLEFLTQEEVEHICWVDNSATRQIACKRGSGKLRHLSGKLLWCQDKVADGSMSVKQVNTALNVADIGTKPLSRARLDLLLYWCNARAGDGHRIGESQHENFKEQHFEKGRIMKMAKFLNRLLIVGGLELAAGSRDEQVIEEEVPYMGWRIMLVFIAVALVAAGFAWMWKKIKHLEWAMRRLQDELDVQRADFSNSFNELELTWSMQADYAQRIHQGLVYVDGFVQDESVKPEEWSKLKFMEKVNRRHDGLRMKRQWALVVQAKEERGADGLPQRPTAATRGEDEPMSSDDGADDRAGAEQPLLSGDTATVELEDGRRVEIPVEYLEPQQETTEPEPIPMSEAEDADDENMSEAGTQPEGVEWNPEPIELPEQDYKFLNEVGTRTELKARNELTRIEASWFHYSRKEDWAMERKLYPKMEECFNFMK